MQLTPPLAIDAKQLSKSFPGSTNSQTATEISLFNDLNLQINTGESVAIIGPSGTGKSTLLSLLACLDTPTSGSVTLAGVDLNALAQEQKAAWRAKNISFVFQSFHLLPELTALENTQLPLDIQGDKNSEKQAKKWLQAVGLEPRVNHFPAQLSGGEQQRVAIARAFVTQPTLLFADEPTGNLDTNTGDKIIELLFDFSAKTQATLVLITHDEHLANRCDRIFKLADGQLIEAIK
ncbi:MAG: ABC transporter ATP-binding protein [Oceanospirillaceae bacterium]|nr:ABC transporter ATP-binding protein [Oceanospirillaceae bacterium]